MYTCVPEDHKLIKDQEVIKKKIHIVTYSPYRTVRKNLQVCAHRANVFFFFPGFVQGRQDVRQQF